MPLYFTSTFFFEFAWVMPHMPQRNLKILRNSSIGDRSPSAIQRWPDIRWPLVETLARIVRLYPLAAGAGAARPLLLPVIRLASEAAKDGNRAEVPC
jgi:hypothetical protein